MKSGKSGHPVDWLCATDHGALTVLADLLKEGSAIPHSVAEKCEPLIRDALESGKPLPKRLDNSTEQQHFNVGFMVAKLRQDDSSLSVNDASEIVADKTPYGYTAGTIEKYYKSNGSFYREFAKFLDDGSKWSVDALELKRLLGSTVFDDEGKLSGEQVEFLFANIRPDRTRAVCRKISNGTLRPNLKDILSE